MNKDIERLSKLKPDWDGLGACPPSSQALDGAQVLLSIMQTIGVDPVRIAAGPDGEILVEVSVDPYVEIEIVDDKGGEFMIVPGDDSATFHGKIQWG